MHDYMVRIYFFTVIVEYYLLNVPATELFIFIYIIAIFGVFFCFLFYVKNPDHNQNISYILIMINLYILINV